MRFTGTVKTWHDDRGFGFIEPAEGGQEIFLHINAFRRGHARPQAGQQVSFEVELGPQGKKRAKAAEAWRRPPPARARRRGPPEWGAASYLVLPAWLLLYLGAALLWKVPNWVGLFYLAASVATFVAYAMDKNAAAAGRSRISEATLLFMGLAGGWPGAILAQQMLRHKSTKASFRSSFWGSVVVNVTAFVLLVSPLRRALLA